MVKKKHSLFFKILLSGSFPNIFIIYQKRKMKLTSASGLTALIRECPTRTTCEHWACLRCEAPWKMAWKPVISSFSVLKLIFQNKRRRVCSFSCPTKLSWKHLMVKEKYGHFIISLDKKETITKLTTKLFNSMDEQQVCQYYPYPPLTFAHEHAH